MRKLIGWMTAMALVAGVSAPAMAAPVTASGSLSMTIGTLPAINLPVGPVQLDYTAGVLTVPAGVAGTTGLFLRVTGFSLDLITGLVVTVSNGAGSFSSPRAAYDAHSAAPAFPVNHVTTSGGGLGGQMPMNGVVNTKGALAIPVPVGVVGNGGRAAAGGIIVDGAPWTDQAAQIITTGPPQAPTNIAGTNMITAGGGGSLTLVTPAHVNAAGLSRLGTVTVLHLDLVGAQPDSDGDGVPDNTDNCPHAANADQLDRGGVGSAAPADGIGDVCQCGDVNGDGKVTTSDAVITARSLLVPPTATMAFPEKCNVGGNSACNIADVTIMKRSLLTPPTATIAQVCTPAL